MSQKPTLKHHLEYLAFRTVEPVARLLPLTTTLGLGRLLGRLAYILDARHRKVVLENIRNSDLGLGEAEARELARTSFAHFGAMFMTSFHLLRMDKADLDRRVRITGLEHWDAARSGGRGFIVLTGH
ncbi:MAG TPA: hypothetical protein VN436_03335, partial [Holophaga sp.]|nr:hypothetical protein [Holophaga sp.]